MWYQNNITMIILFFLICINQIVNQKIEKTYQRVQGVQSFSITNLTKDGFPMRSKIAISLTYYDGEIPIFLLCSNKPNANVTMEYDSITKEQCTYDANAYEDNSKKQVVSLQDRLEMKKYHSNFNIYEFKGKGLFIGAISKLQSSYKIQAEIIPLSACAKDCRYGGSCFQGVCQCMKGSFGDDCSIQGLDILQQTTLSSNYLYYLDIEQLTGATFLRVLSSSINLRSQCYADKPQINHGISILTNLIQIDNDRIQNCKDVTFLVSDQMKVQQTPYYLFKLSDECQVEIIDINDEKVGASTILFILFIPLPIVLILITICCCYKLFKSKANQQHNLQTEPNPTTYVDLYIPTQKFQEIKDTDVHSINLDYQYCSICLEKFDLQNNVKITYCKHLYHSNCLQLWIEKLKVCPLCRAPLDEQTIISMQTQKSMSLIDQITSKSTNKLKPSQASLSFLNNHNMTRFQNNNCQRSLIYLDQ
ncbi:unnamed protein product (macronuclear) [Paramecium tetraurelia]|uniref:RING-type domain-containing protein n=1 Tax=Paramecium tetraurelia TaxID=5888 RepID=A0DPI7_PARTE|nr:uncharacterized protein GSPATT00019136001 [Paramecium tetraurelia]CAK84954.1 unnamed protein product [Paramecium tetraurelia]|eukprot:XP_001452351.1 hypothetical protein (macronuclear) [Paramecium tetraurelia strain d4-2]